MKSALRQLTQSPGFTVVVVLTLALGIGACTTLFSVVNAVLLRPLPFPEADRLTVVWETNAQQRIKREGPSGPNFYDWREQSRLFQDLAAVELGTGTLTGRGDPRQIPGMRVTTNFFSVLNVRPALGRLFTPEDGQGGRQPFVIVSHDFWQNTLAGDPHIIGKNVMVDLIPYQVVGVLAPDFWLPLPSDVFLPWPDDELRLQHGRLAHDLGVFGRLKPGVTATEAESELNAIQANLSLAHPELAGWTTTVVPLQTVSTEYLRPALIALSCAVGVLLLISCTNAANMLLTRAVNRGREVAVRAALGASRWHLLRQFLAESLVLGLIAGALGVLLASWGVSLLSAVIPATIPIPDAAAEVTLRAFEIDKRVLGFSLLVSLLTGLLFGLAPAFYALRTDFIENLKNRTRATTRGGRRLRETFLIAEVALALVLLTAAGLMLRSFARLQHADLGFRSDHLLTLEIELPTDTLYRDRAQQSAFFADVLDRVSSLPGVTSAAVTSVLPLHNHDQRARFVIENGPPLPPNETFQADLRRISPGYFETLGIPLLRGRALDRHDAPRANAALVGVIDAAFAQQFFRDENPLGRHLVAGNTRIEIVGIVGNVKHAGVDRDARPTLYVSFLQSPTERMNLVLRTSAEPAALTQSVKNAIWSIDRNLPVYRIQSMDATVAGATSAPRLTLSLLGVFAAVALGLAAIGIYGVTAYSVSQRTHELGIRQALGADRASVLRLVIVQSMRVVALGLTIGLAVSLALARLAESQLFEVRPWDPTTFTAAITLLLTAALLATYLPALKATRVDPMTALRSE